MRLRATAVVRLEGALAHGRALRRVMAAEALNSCQPVLGEADWGGAVWFKPRTQTSPRYGRQAARSNLACTGACGLAGATSLWTTSLPSLWQAVSVQSWPSSQAPLSGISATANRGKQSRVVGVTKRTVSAHVSRSIWFPQHLNRSWRGILLTNPYIAMREMRSWLVARSTGCGWVCGQVKFPLSFLHAVPPPIDAPRSPPHRLPPYRNAAPLIDDP